MFNEKAKTADAVGAALEKALGSTAKLRLAVCIALSAWTKTVT